MISKGITTAALLCCVTGVSPAFTSDINESNPEIQTIFVLPNRSIVYDVVSDENEWAINWALVILTVRVADASLYPASRAEMNIVFQELCSKLRDAALVECWQGTSLSKPSLSRKALKRNYKLNEKIIAGTYIPADTAVNDSTAIADAIERFSCAVNAYYRAMDIASGWDSVSLLPADATSAASGA